MKILISLFVLVSNFAMSGEESILLTKKITITSGYTNSKSVLELRIGEENEAYAVRCSSGQFSWSPAADKLYLYKYTAVDIKNRDNINIDASVFTVPSIKVFKNEKACRAVETQFNNGSTHIELSIKSAQDFEVITR